MARFNVVSAVAFLAALAARVSAVVRVNVSETENITYLLCGIL